MMDNFDEILLQCCTCTPEYQACGLLEKHCSDKLPTSVDCVHNDENLFCNELSADDITNFQKEFYKDSDRVRQDLFIYTYCDIFPFNGEYMQRPPTEEISYSVQVLSGDLIQVCSKTFTQILNLRIERIYHILYREKDLGVISKISEEKFEAIKFFLTRYKCYITASNCLDCSQPFNNLKTEISPMWFWQLYNEDILQLYNSWKFWTCEFYFFASCLKLFNKPITAFNEEKFKYYCYRCTISKNWGSNIGLQESQLNFQRKINLNGDSINHRASLDSPVNSFNSSDSGGCYVVPQHMAKCQIIKNENPVINYSNNIWADSTIGNNNNFITDGNKEKSPGLEYYKEECNSFVCPVCRRKCKSFDGFKNHFIKHHKYHCVRCNISFAHDDLLKLHMGEQHDATIN